MLKNMKMAGKLIVGFGTVIVAVGAAADADDQAFEEF